MSEYMIPIYRAVFPHGNGCDCEDYRSEECYSSWYFDENLAKLHFADTDIIQSVLSQYYGGWNRDWNGCFTPFIEKQYISKKFIKKLTDSDMRDFDENYDKFEYLDSPYEIKVDSLFVLGHGEILYNVNGAFLSIDSNDDDLYVYPSGIPDNLYYRYKKEDRELLRDKAKEYYLSHPKIRSLSYVKYERILPLNEESAEKYILEPLQLITSAGVDVIFNSNWGDALSEAKESLESRLEYPPRRFTESDRREVLFRIKQIDVILKHISKEYCYDY